MFGFKRRKKLKPTEKSDFNLSPFITGDSPFAEPNWRGLYEHLKKTGEEDSNEAWSDVAIAWAYRVSEDKRLVANSDNFLMVYPQAMDKPEMLLEYMEASRRRILRRMPGITINDDRMLWVVFVFNDADIYERYQQEAYGQASAIASSGMFVHNGYGHFLFPHIDQGFSEPVIAHELTHALVSHLDELPLWINEGMAVNMEHDICRSAPLDLDKLKTTPWNENNIETFFDGSAFRSGKLSDYAYLLGRLIVMSLVREDYDRFCGFVNNANRNDGGRAAAREWFEVDLDGLAFHLLQETSH